MRPETVDRRRIGSSAQVDGCHLLALVPERARDGQPGLAVLWIVDGLCGGAAKAADIDGGVPPLDAIEQAFDFAEQGLRGLLAMSPCSSVVDGTAYPAVLLAHGVNDPHVEVWESMKTAARLKAATSSGKPVWLRLGPAGGHGIGDRREQQLEEGADIDAFLWDALGGGAPR